MTTWILFLFVGIINYVILSWDYFKCKISFFRGLLPLSILYLPMVIISCVISCWIIDDINLIFVPGNYKLRNFMSNVNVVFGLRLLSNVLLYRRVQPSFIYFGYGYFKPCYYV